MKKISSLLAFLTLLLFSCATAQSGQAIIRPVEEKDGYAIINAAIVGDRVLDVSASLGVVPKIISARGSQWPKARRLPGKLIGCPTKITVKKPETLPNIIAKTAIDTVIVEKSDNFCILMPKVDCTNIVPIIKDTGVKIVTIDFTKGYDQAIRDIAALYGKKAEGEALIEKYNIEKAAAEAQIPETASGKKIVVLSTFVKKDTGRLFIQGESKGFYTDRYFLEPFGCENVSDMLNKDGNEIFKGYFTVTNLRLLTEANPDAIIVYGPAKDKLVEKIHQLAAKKEDMAEVPAIKNGKIVSLPYYAGSDVEAYPSILRQWVDYFKLLK